MDATPTAYGTWSGGKFMHFGEALDDARYLGAMRRAYEAGIRTFVTADVYGAGRADAMLGEALAGVPRWDYRLVGMVGHDFVRGVRQGSSGYPRFTSPDLRGADDYRAYLEEATTASLERCRTDHFDTLLLHNPDETGYTSDAVWEGMRALRDQGLARRLGIAPGPANGFTLDIIDCFERFAEVVDEAMIILNPNEPWPGRLVLPAARACGVEILARVVDYGGVFWGDVRPGHLFKPGDHRSYRPEGWVEDGCQRLEAMRPVADRHGLTPIQLAAAWCLSQQPVRSVVPTVIQEHGENARPIEDKIDELAALPAVLLDPGEVEEIARIGDNTGCMALKGASRRHHRSERPDEWPMRPDLEALAARHGLAAV